jgi:hypothetical protein
MHNSTSNDEEDRLLIHDLDSITSSLGKEIGGGILHSSDKDNSVNHYSQINIDTSNRDKIYSILNAFRTTNS